MCRFPVFVFRHVRETHDETAGKVMSKVTNFCTSSDTVQKKFVMTLTLPRRKENCIRAFLTETKEIHNFFY